jgi:hypothetical protein
MTGRKHVLYLGILVAVAAVGVARLALQQRREQRKRTDPRHFKASLERLARAPTPPVAPFDAVDRASRGGRVARGRRGARVPEPLEPARQDAARRRLEARRAARASRGG